MQMTTRMIAALSTKTAALTTFLGSCEAGYETREDSGPRVLCGTHNGIVMAFPNPARIVGSYDFSGKP